MDNLITKMSELELLMARIKNWYIRKNKNVYLLCGDTYWYMYNEKPIFRFETYGIINVLKNDRYTDNMLFI
jgi:hypothetical protein